MAALESKTRGTSSQPASTSRQNVTFISRRMNPPPGRVGSSKRRPSGATGDGGHPGRPDSANEQDRQTDRRRKDHQMYSRPSSPRPPPGLRPGIRPPKHATAAPRRPSRWSRQ